MAGATHLIIGASDTTLDGGVRFPSEFFIIADAFAPGQVLNFGSLAYVIDCYGKLCPLNRVMLVDNELSTSPPPLGLLGADLKVLAQQI